LKFCYADESDSGDGALVVAVGVIVDGSRMHLTKADWSELLGAMSRRVGAQLREFKASDLYRGSGRWYGVPDEERAKVIGDIVKWLEDRKHNIAYTGIIRSSFNACSRPERGDLPDTWCAADAHLLLAIQRCHQRERSNKGHTVVVLDQGGHEGHLLEFARTPPAWTDDYYGRRRRDPPLNQIIDVPYFVDSAHAFLVQTADLFAYILRRYVELTDRGAPERYRGESAQVAGWAKSLARRAYRSDLWPSKKRTAAHELFAEIAPPSLVGLRA
jgi:hypothetical protein